MNQSAEAGKNREHRGRAAIAYFSMEVGIDPALHTYSGGLGILAGDTLCAAADLGIPMVGMTLLYRKGYFRQHLDARGRQSESPVEWSPEDVLEPMAPRVSVAIEGRPVAVRAWRYLVRGQTGCIVPLYFMDTDLPENSPADRTLTDHLYGGDDRYRLSQEAVLGLGGVAMLQALGHARIRTYHMNEGHSALLTLALLGQRIRTAGPSTVRAVDTTAIRRKCVFTTHTPVPAGHDDFPLDLVKQVLAPEHLDAIRDSACCPTDRLNMTSLVLFFSRYINGVAMRHGEISRGMYPAYPINSITNGVHAMTWTAPAFRRLYDKYIPEWSRDHIYLRYAISIPLDDIRQAHAEAKRALLDEVKRRTGAALDPAVLTLGFARRATAYKRADMLLSDPDRLRRIVREAGPLQIVYAGKAHPRDEGGKDAIRRVCEALDGLKDVLPAVYLEDYDMTLAARICAGVDVWLNTPQKPQEASGTSGMKAALNGVPSLSVLDGWWIEGHLEGITGWSIGDGWRVASDPAAEAASLYDKLENQIAPAFYGAPNAFAEIMRYAIAINGSFFNAQRMVSQYLRNAYRPAILSTGMAATRSV